MSLKRLILLPFFVRCLIRGQWRTLLNFPGYPVSGHDLVEQPDGKLVCACGFFWPPHND